MMNVENLKVTVKVKELIDALTTNKALHITEFKIAKKLYFEKLLAALLEFKRAAENEENRSDNYNAMLVTPQYRVDEYNKYIGMLEMATEDTLIINTYQYDCFVNDTWEWAMSAKTANSTYLAH